MKKIFIAIISLTLIIAGTVLVKTNLNTQKNPNEEVSKKQSNTQTNKSYKNTYEISSSGDYISVFPQDLYNSADLVIVGKYVKDEKIFLGNVAQITTESKFNIRSILKGEVLGQKNPNSIQIQYYGGEVPLEEYISKLSPGQLEKGGLDKLSKNEIKESKVVYKTVKNEALTLKDKDTTKDYLIFLSYNPENQTYFVMSEGYGMRQIDKAGNIYNPDTNAFKPAPFSLNLQ